MQFRGSMLIEKRRGGVGVVGGGGGEGDSVNSATPLCFRCYCCMLYVVGVCPWW